MTKALGRAMKEIVVIYPPEMNQGCCEMCGTKAELRPYGPRGESVCFQCAMQDEEAAKRQFRNAFGE